MNLNAEYLPKNDPIMQELWAIKAQINQEAGYSVQEIVRRMKEKYPAQQADLNAAGTPSNGKSSSLPASP